MSDNILETARICLRPLTLEDLDALAALYADPDVRRYFPEGTQTRDETKEELEWIIDVYYGQYGFGLWATIEKATGTFIGRCGLLPWTIASQPEIEVAYLLDKRYWRQGLGTEIGRALADYAFEHLPVSRVICLIDPANQASIGVAKKIGMVNTGDVEFDGVREPFYSLDRSSIALTLKSTEDLPSLGIPHIGWH